MAVRWKLLVVLGAGLIVLALAVDWAPPSEPSLPATRPLLLFLGAVVAVAGLIAGLTHERSADH